MRDLGHTNKTPPRRRRILLYGDVNLNVMDGSAVWLASMAEVLARTNSTIDVLLKTRIDNDRLVKKLSGSDSIRFIDPADGQGSMSPRLAAQKMLGLNALNQYDVVIARGLQICQFVAGSDVLASKAWLYVTDLPFPASSFSDSKLAAITKIATRAKRVFAQTEDARSYLESVVPEAAGKTILLPPMVPDEFFRQSETQHSSGDKLRIIYAGKFAKNWRTLEMCGLEAGLRREGVDAEVTFVGDKFQDDLKDPGWPDRMRAAISGPEVRWLGGLSREATMSVVAKSDIGLGWRDASMDSSLEISTKALEYAAAGVCPLVNRTAAHERLFGEDYPFFVDHDDIHSVIDTIANNANRLGEAKRSIQNAADYYSVGRAAERLEDAFRRAEGAGLITGARASSTRPVRIVLAGHDFKFAGELVDLLRSEKGVELRLDQWSTLHKHDEQMSSDLLEWADIIMCEWAGPNAVWYSRNKRVDQKLIIRLHAFELRGPWLSNIVTDSVDAVVCVSELYKRLISEKTSWPVEKISVIPNAIDALDLNRPKLDGHQFRLGMIGMVPFLKRPDRALSVLEQILQSDSRFTLHIKGRMPWEYAYEWRKPLQQQAYMEFFGKIGRDDSLRSRVVFEPFGADIGSWLMKIGYVLSPSTHESFHVAPAEGMASGAVPLFWDRPGVSEIFGDEFKYSDSSTVAAKVMELSASDVSYEEASLAAKTKAKEFDAQTVKSHWSDLLSALIVARGDY